MQKKLLLISMICILLGCAGCGQTGSLYLPQTKIDAKK